MADIINKNSQGVAVVGHIGTWYTIDAINIDGHDYFLMEHETYGDECASIILNATGTIILEDVYNGFDDLRYFLENNYTRGDE